ncbi:MAG: PDGLE domain-containing protein [Kiritimatiellia bacterium]
MKTITKCWIGLGVLALLSPLGLILPDHFKAGSAWGEWGADEFQKMIGYVPEGLSKLGELWKAPLPDYAFKGCEEKGITHLSVAYIFSAILGVALTVGVIWLLGRFLVKKGDTNAGDR